MRKMIILLALFGFNAAAVNLSVEGTTKFQWERIADGTFANLGVSDEPNVDNNIDSDLRVGILFRPTRNVTAKMTLSHHFDFGASFDEITHHNGEHRVTPVAFTSASLALNESYITWAANKQIMFILGRSSFTLAGGDVISPNEYEDLLVAFDGVRAMYNLRSLGVHVWALRLANGGVPYYKSLSYGGAVTFNSLPRFVETLELSAMRNDIEASGIAKNIIDRNSSHGVNRLSIHAAGEVDRFDWNATYSMENGAFTGESDKAINTNMLDVEVGARFPKLMDIRVHALYHRDTGGGESDDEQTQYEAYYYDINNNAGFMDVLLWGNLSYYGGGVTLEPMRNITVAATYYNFKKTDHAANNRFGRDFENLSVNDASANLGSEIDLSVSKRYGDNLTVGIRYGIFTPDLAMNSAENSMNYGAVNAAVSF